MQRALAKSGAKLVQFGRAREGVAAVEFGLVAFPFLLLMIGLVEVCLIGFSQSNLNYAVSQVARDIRTGRAQTDGVSHTEMQTAICDKIDELMHMDCDGKLFLDVKSYPSFVNIDIDPPVEDGEFDDSNFGFTPGDPSDVVVVRAFYRWHVITPLLGSVFANAGGDERVLAATMMFRNEPFPDPTP